MVDANLFGLGWRPIFFVNVPIGIVAILLTQFLVQESKSASATSLDLGGALLSGVGLFCLIFPISEGRERGWPWWAFALLAVAGLILWLFLRFEKQLAARGGAPLVDLKLFQAGGFGRGLIGILLLFSGIGSFALTLTLFLQDGLHITARQTGVIFGALSVSFLISSLNAVSLIARIGPKALLVGLAIMQSAQLALIFVVLHWRGSLNPYFLMPILFVYGLGQGLCVPQLMRQTLDHVDGANAGAASGLLSMTQQVAFTIGIATVGGLFFVARGAEKTADSYARALATAFICNFVLVLVTRLLVARNIRQDAGQAAAAGVPIAVEG